MQTLAPCTGTAFRLKKGQSLKVVDPQGQQVADLFCFNAGDHEESLSSSRSIDYADTIYLSTGHVLYSNRSQPLFKIIDDSCGRHDLLMPPCSLAMFQIVAGNHLHHPSCHENLATNFAQFDIRPDRITTTFNLFMNVQINHEGQLKINPPLSVPQSFIVLEAQIDLVVGLTACSHEETNAGRCKPIGFEIF